MSDINRRDNSGFLGKNDYKEKPNQPDYTGKATVDGTEYKISAWIKEREGRKLFSLAFTPAEAKPAPKPVEKPDFEDEIPF